MGVHSIHMFLISPLAFFVRGFLSIFVGMFPPLLAVAALGPKSMSNLPWILPLGALAGLALTWWVARRTLALGWRARKILNGIRGREFVFTDRGLFAASCFVRLDDKSVPPGYGNEEKLVVRAGLPYYFIPWAAVEDVTRNEYQDTRTDGTRSDLWYTFQLRSGARTALVRPKPVFGSDKRFQELLGEYYRPNVTLNRITR